MKKIEIIRSETWMNDDLDSIHNVLEETIKDFVDEKDRIINIQVVDRNGQSRFWIYIETNN